MAGSTTTEAARRSRLSFRLILATLLGLLAFAAVFGSAAAQPAVPDFVPDKRVAQLEQDFLMGMIPHHRSAVMMAKMAVEKASKPELRALAQRIIDSQNVEIEVMSNYLRDWYGMQPPAGDMMSESMMRGMDMPMMHGTMPTMNAMMAQMDALNMKTGQDFDIAFMSHMSEHHAMAVMMASPVLISGYHGDLYKLAAQIVKDQGEEIVQMQNWLETWYGLDRPMRN
ncbi:MAG: DUF305 domain-containing protein [Roseiflexaceae bacterium]